MGDNNNSICENSGIYGKDKHGKFLTCSDMFNCCNCGKSEDGCGCKYCFSCNACSTCLNEE